MKKLLCLVLTVLLILPLSLYGCESDPVDTSSPASSASTPSSTESIPGTPSEEASEPVSDAPSEDPSDMPSEDISDETSTNPEQSEDPKEDDPVENIRDNPNYANIAKGKSYTISSLHPNNSSPAYPDEGNKSMTDGKLPATGGGFSDTAFMGFNKNTDYTIRGYSFVSVDLGGLYCLDEFVTHVGSKMFLSAGIAAPDYAWVYVSHDGKEWHRVGRTSHEDTDAVNCVASTLTLDTPVTARYVEFRFVSSISNWIFVAEVEAFGIPAEEEIPYDEKSVIDILFVGNSSTYYFNVPDKLLFLAESTGKTVEVTYCCVGSAYLYMFADPNSTTHGIPLRNYLSSKKYDYIVVQDNSGAEYDQIKSAMDVLMPLFRENGGEVLLYMRYSSNTDPAQRPISAYRHHVNYNRIAEDFDIDKVAPVADAFMIGYKKYPNINLHFTDNSHHSDAGAYLIACVMAITYFDIDLGDVTYTAGLDTETVKALKEVARIACETGYDYDA